MACRRTRWSLTTAGEPYKFSGPLCRTATSLFTLSIPVTRFVARRTLLMRQTTGRASIGFRALAARRVRLFEGFEYFRPGDGGRFSGTAAPRLLAEGQQVEANWFRAGRAQMAQPSFSIRSRGTFETTKRPRSAGDILQLSRTESTGPQAGAVGALAGSVASAHGPMNYDPKSDLCHPRRGT